MVINGQALAALNVSFQALFMRGMSQKAPKYPRIATEVPSSTSEENYGWLGQLPGMEEWIGERTIKNLEGYTYTIRNRTFESTISIDREVLEDDRYGIYRPQIEMMGAAAATAPDDTVFEALQDGFVKKCYDGKPFFSQDHACGGQIYSNMTQKKLSQESFLEARASIMSYRGDKGKSLRLVPDLLIVPPALEAKAREILEADIINGTSNTTKGLAKLEVVQELSGDPDAWYLLVTTESMKPLILQMRRKPKFTSLTKEDDPNVFLQKKYLYGTDGRWNAGYGFWQMAYGSTGTAEGNG